MATIIEILATDQPKDSRTDINANFAALDADKVESGDSITGLTVGQLNVTDINLAHGLEDVSSFTSFAISGAGFGLYFRSENVIRWSNFTTWNTTFDTGVGRASAGVLEVNDGNAGVLRDIKVRNVLTTLTTPASAAAAGVAGTIVADANFIYVCTATNTWKRVAISTW